MLTSFGIARSPEDSLGAAGAVVGKTIYFSPEQALGDRATHLSDIFEGPGRPLTIGRCLGAGRRGPVTTSPLPRATTSRMREPGLFVLCGLIW